MVLEWYYYVLFGFAGLLAGIVNTLAGNGSVFTLSLLIFSGMPVGLANGTNRLGAFVQCIISLLTLKKTTKFNSLYKESLWFIPPSIIGSIFGAFSAIQISDKVLTNTVGYLMIFMLFLAISKPKNWFINSKKRESNKSISNFIIFFFIGSYAGFIQMGMGILFLTALVLISKYSILDANIIKIIICTTIILPSLAIYIYFNQVAWNQAIALTIGQGFGAWLATKYALQNNNSILWVKRLIILMISLTLVKLFNIHSYIF
tara:strand:- start:1329 stop:2108 length:780 start_codon:yes stop_codon:yes gene_type:complete